MKEFRLVGKPLPRLDGVDSVTGRATYTVDIALPGLLHARLFRSPVPHAKIRRLDVTRAPNVHPNVDFLFPNCAELERDYFKRTRFLPIMHTLIIKNSPLEKNPWVAMSIFDAWQESKKKCYEWLQWQRVHQTALWYRALWEEEQSSAGADPYLWGFRSTRPEVDKLLDYCHRQGLTTRKFEPEEMFHPTTLET